VNWSIRWTRAAEKDMRRLDAVMARRVLTVVDRFAETGQGDLKRLVDHGGEFRLRAGDFRAILQLDLGGHSAVVLRVLHRSDAYR
jgi:mRNA-degrading endonuclease RelE of RelBE toxin-antitoxin system